MITSFVEAAFRARDVRRRPGSASPVYVVVETSDELGGSFARDTLHVEREGIVSAALSRSTFLAALGPSVGRVILDKVRCGLPDQVMMVCIAHGGTTFFSPTQTLRVFINARGGSC